MTKDKFLDPKDIYINGEIVINDSTVEDIYHLADIVINKHYSYLSVLDKEEYKSVCMFKALNLIESGGFDTSVSSLKNYLYTGMRNEISNSIYRKNREYLQDEFYDAADDNENLEEMNISKNDIMRFKEKYKIDDNMIKQVAYELCLMGFRLEKGTPIEEVEDEYRTNKWVCLFVWDYSKTLV